MSLFSALRSTASSLAAFEQALTVTQNNVNNASTPGYARQTQGLEALPFDATTGETGGVTAGSLQDSRDEYAEQNVRNANSQLGQFEQQIGSLTNLQSQFDVSGSTGIPAAFSSIFSAFSNWSVSPNDTTARQNVISTAQSVASAFQGAASSISKIGSQTDSATSALVQQVNSLAAQLSGYNAQIQAAGGSGPALSAAVHSTLETLSEIANVTTINQPNGTVSVLLGGQTTLVDGSTQNKISVNVSVPTTPPPTNPSGAPTARILDASGNDVTAQVTGGKLGGALNIRNQVLPAIQGDAYQQGSLNQLAQAFADRVNTLLTSGNISDGPPVQSGVPLFTYDAANPTNIANSLQVSSTITGDQLAAISPGPPYQSNGVALSLAGLSSGKTSADQINGQTYTEFFGTIGASVGSQLSSAQSGQSVQKDLVSQARSMRDQLSGVDLNEEATQVLQFQRSYEAASKMMTVIDSMTQTVLNLIGTGS
jgi:flagellar hook-associated protein 1